MCNNTLEDNYKIEVKRKYEEVKSGEHFSFLENPTRAKLSNLCWEIFVNNRMNTDDLNTFNSVLGIPFDLNTRNRYRDRERIDRFRPIETFFKGETNPLTMEVVDLAAILVGFESRPFNKFRLRGFVANEAINDYRTESISKEYQKEKPQDLIVLPDSNKGKRNDIEVSPTFPKYIAPMLVACLIGLIIFLALPKKECMQWTGDHYELVDCNFKQEGLIMANPVELLDESLVDLKKIKVCDTTVYFDKNENAIIWYAKRGDSVDFFNGHGRHPLNNSPLKPVTKYILDKYVNNKEQK